MAHIGVGVSLEELQTIKHVRREQSLFLTVCRELHNPFRFAFIAIVISILFASYGRAQVVATGQTVNGETATPAPGGHDYSHFLAETVNPSNGSVSITIQFPTPKGRGISLPYSFRSRADRGAWNNEPAGE